MPLPKLACSTTLFLKYSVENSIQIIKDIGYEGVEILCDRPHAFPLDDEIAWKEEINSIKKAISKANLPISNLNAFSMRGLGDAGDVFRPSWIESEAEKRELRINYTKECIKLAKRLGAKSISTEPGGLVSESSHTSEPLKDFINGLKTIIPVAEEHDVKILVEPTPGCIIENSKQLMHFWDK